MWMVLLAMGIFFQWQYNISPNKAINTSKIENIIAQKEKNAETKINQISKLLEKGTEDALRKLTFQENSLEYFVFRDNKLIFWTSNEFIRIFTDSPQWKYYTSANASFLAKTVCVNNYYIVAYIPLKYNFAYENNELSNDFATGFDLNKAINIVEGNSSDKFAIHGKDNIYLFSLQLPENEKIYNENWAKAGLIVFFIMFVVFFYLYARFPLFLKKTHISWKEFLLFAFTTLTVIALCLFFNLPDVFFQNNIFTSFTYSSNPILATLTHLTVFTLYVFSTIYLFSFYVKKSVSPNNILFKKTFLLALPAIYYLLMYNIFMGLIFNSSTDLNVLSVSDLKTTTLWNHFLLLIWGLGYMLLFLKTHKMAKKEKNFAQLQKIDLFIAVLMILLCFVLFDKYAIETVVFYLILTSTLYIALLNRNIGKSKWYLVIFVAVFTLFVIDHSVRMNFDKKFSQYKLLAENLYYNEASQEEKMTELMFLDLEKSINNDFIFKELALNPDSVTKANEYLNAKYLRGFWSKFEMKLFSTFPQSDAYQAYQDLIKNSGKTFTSAHFYKIEKSTSDIAYLGIFQAVKNQLDTVSIFMEFYPRSYYKSYSYPNLLIQSPPTVQSRLSLSTARYSHNDLIYSNGKFKFPRNGKWINYKKNDFFVQDFSSSRHYIFAPSQHNYMIVSEANIPTALTYVLYYLYTYVAYLLICLLFFGLYYMVNRKTKIVYNLTSKLLISFISLMVICFAAIFYVSYSYTQEKYREKQLQDIDTKKTYIQNALQEKYYWNQKLDSSATSKLNFDLQDLSYTYQTDINVYDNNGILIGTSQPAIFGKNLVSKLISPKPFFSTNPNINQTEHIGKLEYLATYTDFYNGEFLPIGFISVPQFLSKDEYNADVQSFLVMIAHISLVIIILFIVISIFIGRKLTAPLTMIENRMKDIRLGKVNKKIDYKGNDEIGQLVTQYNRTVDELEQSAQRLAASERELAWKTMARQVAHEINNPLTPMKLTIQQLQRAKTMKDSRFDQYFEKSTDVLIEQIDNLSQIAGSFSTFARLPEPQFEKVDVAKTANMVTQLFVNNNENVKVTFQGNENGVFANTDSEQLIQVFNNLLKNALQAIPTSEKGKIIVTVKSKEKNIDVLFKDNGKGIPTEIKDKLFTPNFTTKSTGMGLGLAISRNIIRNSGGDITFDSKENEGTTFKVSLPKIN